MRLIWDPQILLNHLEALGQTVNLENFWMKVKVLVTWISPENIWDPDFWMQVLFLDSKREVDPHLSFISVLLARITSLTSSSVEKVIKAHSEYCQELCNVNLSNSDDEEEAEVKETGKEKERGKMRQGTIYIEKEKTTPPLGPCQFTLCPPHL